MLTHATELGYKHAIAMWVGFRLYFNHGDCISVKTIDQEDCVEILDRLRVVTPACEVTARFCKLPLVWSCPLIGVCRLFRLRRCC